MYQLTSLDKTAVAEALERKDLPEDVRRVLELRQQTSKTSNKKFDVMVSTRCKDDRIRGTLQFYGANRSGRYCLAEGTKILVKDIDGDVYEKPIQEVKLSDMVYDGDSWVQHEGVMFMGDKDVITYDGITATPDHPVYISDNESVPLLYAKEHSLKIMSGT